MSSINEFKVSRTIEDFANNVWIAAARSRDPARWREASLAEQARGIDYWLKIEDKWYSFEVKTENYPVNYFVELYQLVESRKSFELGYAYKCEADFLVLSNLLGLFAVIVPRKAFLNHTIDAALAESHSRELSLVVNAKKDVVERAAIGFPLSYVKSLSSFNQPWALVDLNFVSSHKAAVQFLAKSAWYLSDEQQRLKEANDKMADGRKTFAGLAALANRTCGTRRLEAGFESLVAATTALQAPAINYRRDDTFNWTQKGLVTTQARFAERFTNRYNTTYESESREVAVKVRAAHSARASAAQPANVA
jgi:hypothetical protein